MNYTITVNETYNSKEIYFDSKPGEAIREALKTLKFRWNRKKSCWYGFASESEIIEAIENDPVSELGGVASDGYMGAIRWDGNKSGKHLYGSELTAALRADAKRIGLKGVTFSKETYSGGQSVTATIKASEDDFRPFEEVRMEYLKEALKREWLVMADGSLKHAHSFESYNCDEYLDAQERTARELYEDDCSNGLNINHYYLERYHAFSEAFMEKVNLVLRLLMTYNSDGSNAMVDYFNTNFYFSLKLKKI